MTESYRQLESIFLTLSHLQGAAAVLHWDYATMMPSGSAEARSNQLATLQTLCHQQLTAPEVSDLLDNADEQASQLNDWERANLQRMRHRWLHATAVEESLVEALSKAGSECEMVWRKARADNDFATYAPYQQRVLELVREQAAQKADGLGLSPYDAMLDTYDPGRRSAEIDTIFAQLGAVLPDLTQRILERQQTPLPLSGTFPAEKQRALGLRFMNAIGFNFDKGRLDTSHHPFCGGIPDDVRITTRYDENDFTSALMGVLHETGHALYESQLPADWRGQPVGDALGMSIHESQSLLMEMQVCRSPDFLHYAAPIIREIFGVSGNAWETSNLCAASHQVSSGLIRVDADEVTYPSHVILRYRIETKLLDGSMEVTDIPETWNREMKTLLNVDMPNDKDGCMQDIHWTDGSFGYFPTYTLGAIHAAQFYRTLRKQHPGIPEEIRKGHFKPLTNWLKTHIHALGSRYTANELVERVTGEPLNVSHFIEHLKERYLT